MTVFNKSLMMAAALSAFSFGGLALAADDTSEAARHAAAMQQGKSHEDARVASSRQGADTSAAKATKHEHAMNKGASHEDAREAADAADSAAGTQAARKHAEKMNEGASHEDARK